MSICRSRGTGHPVSRLAFSLHQKIFGQKQTRFSRSKRTLSWLELRPKQYGTRCFPPGVQIQLEQLLSCERIQVRAWLGYLVSLHDLGKVEENFQYQWPEMKQRMDEAGLKPAFFTGKVRHEKTTAASLRNHIWPNTTEAKRLVRFYAGILEAHHQGKVGEAVLECASRGVGTGDAAACSSSGACRCFPLP